MAVKESYAGKINRKLTKKLRVIAVAAGREKADLVLKNATYVNVFSNELCHGDIAVAEGTPVHCAQDGQVVQAGFNSIRGNYIIVRHTDGLQTLYQHLACGFVRAGEGVTRGQVIASAGSTGMSTGAHLHFELIYNGVRYDPSAALLAS